MTSTGRARSRLNWHQQHVQHLSFGERAADVMRNSMGSWRFVFGFIVFMLIWAAINSVASGWDPYPFILITLFLSMLTGLQGAILLIAAKRQDGIAAGLAPHDFDTNTTAKADIEALLEINRSQATLLDEMCQILRRLDAVPQTDSSASSA